MSAVIPSNVLEFLSDLKYNNNREWFAENKPRYQEAKEEFENFVEVLIERISEFDPTIVHLSAKDCVFRIFRDVRFSKNKDPYKFHFGANITAAPKKSEIHNRAGYYLHIEPEGKSMLGGGAYMPNGKWLKEIRASIDYDPEMIKGIINKQKFKALFGQLEGEKLKTSPRDYPADHPEIELLRYKSLYGMHHCDDRAVEAKGFLEHSADVFTAISPLNKYLNMCAEQANDM